MNPRIVIPVIALGKDYPTLSDDEKNMVDDTIKDMVSDPAFCKKIMNTILTTQRPEPLTGSQDKKKVQEYKKQADFYQQAQDALAYIDQAPHHAQSATNSFSDYLKFYCIRLSASSTHRH